MSIQLKRSLSSEIDTSYILEQGQIGIEMPSSTNTKNSFYTFKIGDGATPYSNLPIANIPIVMSPSSSAVLPAGSLLMSKDFNENFGMSNLYPNYLYISNGTSTINNLTCVNPPDIFYRYEFLVNCSTTKPVYDSNTGTLQSCKIDTTWNNYTSKPLYLQAELHAVNPYSEFSMLINGGIVNSYVSLGTSYKITLINIKTGTIRSSTYSFRGTDKGKEISYSMYPISNETPPFLLHFDFDCNIDTSKSSSYLRGLSPTFIERHVTCMMYVS